MPSAADMLPPPALREQGFWNGSLPSRYWFSCSATDLSSQPHSTVGPSGRPLLKAPPPGHMGPHTSSHGCYIFTASVRAAGLRPLRDPDVDGLWHGVPRGLASSGGAGRGPSLHGKLTVSTLFGAAVLPDRRCVPECAAGLGQRRRGRRRKPRRSWPPPARRTAAGAFSRLAPSRRR